MKLRRLMAGLLLLVLVLAARNGNAKGLENSETAEGSGNPGQAASPIFQRTSERGSGRYFFNLLDHRSRYGTGFFPEHFRQTSLDAEHELRADYFHGEHSGRRESEIESEVEWAINNLTLTIEGEWESEHEFDADAGSFVRNEGWQTVKFKAHHPVYQFVSSNDFLDYTLVGKVSVGLPLAGNMHTDDYEIQPLLGQMLRLGEHFSAQTWTGVNFVTGSKDGGNHELRYGALLGWNISHKEMPIPGTVSATPLLELDGQRFLAGPERGDDRLFGVAGVRVNFVPVGPVQPRVGVGYLFPIDEGARQELSWGVQTSLILEF
jgi:hypothetical protein